MRELKAFLVITLSLVLFVACAADTTPTLEPATATPVRNSPTNTRNPATRTRAVTPTRATATVTTLPPTVVATNAAPTAVAVTNVPSTQAPPTVAVKLPAINGLDNQTLAGWQTFVANVEAINDGGLEQNQVDQFWQELTAKQDVPLRLNDGAVFLYKGAAESVHWQGDFSYWDSGVGLDGTRVGGTDLWYAVAKFPMDSRTDYEIVVNGERGIRDPANPRTRYSTSGTNSVLAMPKFTVTDFTRKRDDVAEGVLTDWTPLDSDAWGAPIRYSVYTPADYAALEKLPVLYVTDGNDFADTRQGAMQIALDNLIADGKMAPVIAVFVDARNANDPSENERNTQFLSRPEDFAEFLVRDLVPKIDADYKTDATPQGRALAGVSFGGAFTTFAGLKYADVFGKLAIFSPAYWVFGNPNGVGGSNSTGASRMNAYVQSRLNETAVKTNQTIYLSAGISGWDVGDMKPWATRLRGIGANVQQFGSQEGHSWGAWTGLTDEMLEFLFPAS